MNWKAKIMKTVIYITLMTCFFKFSMMDVIKEYQGKKTNFAKSTLPNTGVNFPALSFCFDPMVKPSMKDLHNVSSFFCIDPYFFDKGRIIILQELNVTWNELCLNISYKINRDFTIHLRNSFRTNNETKLNLYVNDFDGKKVEVRQIMTKHDGLCYTLLSNLKFNRDNFYIVQISLKVRILSISTTLDLISG